jgi:hypothetical protein
LGAASNVSEPIGSQKLHFQLVHHHRHWTPSSLLMPLDLIVNSVQNVISHLLVVNGEPGPVLWARPGRHGDL